MFEERLKPQKIERDKQPEAIEIVRLGDYDKIKEKLSDKGLLGQERERVREKFSSFIELSDFPTKQEKLWDLLTILELYDPETATHSIRTYQIAKEKVEKVLSKNIVLSRIIESEGVDLERFYFACLTHDIGKVEIPHFIIKNATTKKQWEEKLQEITSGRDCPQAILQKLGFEMDAKPSPMEINEKIENSYLCAEEILPVKYGLSSKETEELEKVWHISPNSSLMDIIDKHADISGNILEKEGFPIVAEIVRNHHHKLTNSFDVSIESLKISSDMSDILHLADVEQALISSRSYKTAFAPLKTVETLTQHAQKGKVGKEIAYLWIKDEYEKLKESLKINVLDLDEVRSLKAIEDFIEKFETGEYKNEFDSWLDSRLENKRLSA